MSFPQLSGFADEISPSFDEQLRVLRKLDMRWMCIRTADGRSIADYTPQEVRTLLLPRLRAAGVGVSSLGSPIGKIPVEDGAALARQLEQLEQLCESCALLGCRFIRVFSFYLPKGKDPGLSRERVLDGLGRMIAVARRYGVTLIHENEKEIYGDTLERCLDLMKALHGPHFAAAFDFANFVQCGEEPLRCWEALAPYVAYIHIKDARRGLNENVLCGTGDGCIAPILRDAILGRRYAGFLTLEPHLVLFDALSSLETADAREVIREDKYSSGEEGFCAQHAALLELLRPLARAASEA